MSSLENLQINDTFPGLIKTNNEAAVDGTLRTLQDGAGNNLPIEVSTSGVNFTGTVTGLPADVNTTYDLYSDQSGANVAINLQGSDATLDTINLVAGTNITLTNTGLDITIDATGGGGGSPTRVGLYNTTIATVTATSGEFYTFNIPTAGGVLVANTPAASPGVVSLSPVTYLEGDVISGFQFRIFTATAGVTVDIGIYTSEIVGGKLSPAALIGTIATGIDASTAGAKSVGGLSITLPASEYNLYWVGILSIGGSAQWARPQIPMAMVGNLNANSNFNRPMMYRTQSSAFATLPTSVTGEALTNVSLDAIIFGTY